MTRTTIEPWDRAQWHGVEPKQKQISK